MKMKWSNWEIIFIYVWSMWETDGDGKRINS